MHIPVASGKKMNISNEQKNSIDRWTAIGHLDKNNFIFFR